MAPHFWKALAVSGFALAVCAWVGMDMMEAEAANSASDPPIVTLLKQSVSLSPKHLFSVHR